MSQVRSIRVVAAVSALTLLAACSSGSEDATPTTTTASPETTAVVTTVPEDTSTTVAPTTAPPTTEPAPTTEPTAPPTTEGPTTSDVPPTTSETIRPRPDDLPSEAPPRVSFPDDPDLQAIVDGFYAYRDALTAALMDPTDQALRDAVVATTEDPQRTRVEVFIDKLASNGEASRQPEGTVSYTDVAAFTVFAIDEDATLDTCLVDTSVTVKVGAGENGDDQVVNNLVVSLLQTYSFKLRDGTWVVANVERVSAFEDEVGCG